MFPDRYFPAIFFADRYFPPGGSAPPAPSPAPSDNFIPRYFADGEQLGNIRIIYDKARTLPKKETLGLKEAIEAFIEDQEEKSAALPDIEKINLQALQANAIASRNFMEQLDMMRQKIFLLEKLQADEQDFMLLAFLACTIN